MESAQLPVMLGQRLLLVDDDESVLNSLDAVFKMHGFETTCCSTVSEALRSITKHPFDIVVTDLNIGEPGDGFTVVSALRRVQPNAAALIITGYPAFDNALQAIREQVDDYVVKPISPPDLLQTIERIRSTRSTHVPIATKRISAIVREHRTEIEGRWLERVREYAKEIGRNDLDDSQLLDHLPTLIDELCSRVEERRSSTSVAAKEAAAAHGKLRREQRLDASCILHEGTELRQQILRTVHDRLLQVNLSNLILDLAGMSESLDDQLTLSMEAHLGKF
jgi:ActR/RegA family two-component response regulator